MVAPKNSTGNIVKVDERRPVSERKRPHNFERRMLFGRRQNGAS
jgi:hypothetical protein